MVRAERLGDETVFAVYESQGQKYVATFWTPLGMSVLVYAQVDRVRVRQ